MNEQQARDFAQQTVFSVTPSNNFASCVDGRYTPEQTGAIAMAGADAGLLLAGLATATAIQREMGITIPDEVVLEAAYEAVGGKLNFKYHSDTHAGLLGCGHNKLAITNYESYGLTAEQATFFKATLETLQTAGIAPTKLEGDHQEKAVLIIELPEYKPEETTNATYSLYHQKEIDGQTVQAFVYNKTLTTKCLQEFAKTLKAQLESELNLTHIKIFERLATAEENQRNLTVKTLALDKGIPVYTTIIDNEGSIKL